MTLSIRARANHYGSRLAVVDYDGDETNQYDYADLAAMADEYTRLLADHGVGHGDPVCVLSRNRPELLGLFFAAVESGAILAPISHRLPADTVEALRKRIEPALTLREERFEELASDAPTLESFTTGEPKTTEVERNPPGRDDERPVLYLHTGGTTGIPKVVVLPARQIEWNCITEVSAWGLGKEDVSATLLPLFHTGGWNLLTLPTLYVGGQVVIHREFDPASALASIEDAAVTRVFAVAAIFQAMAAADAFDETDFSTVEWFMSGGGPTPAGVMEVYRERGQRFTQGYGLTEGGPNNLYFDPSRPDIETADESVGRPFPNCSARIADEDGTPLPADETGELELSGPITATGYLETADGTFEGQWVSTGDLARRDAEGDYYITGRTDNMFVSGGENVYPEEIESTLDRRDDIDAAGVVGISHDQWGTVPKAVVVGSSNLSVETLESYCRNRLADYEVPHAFEFVDELPRSGPGKIDRKTLETEFGTAADRP
ncbi:class I adenylate-forming enzyme family protein [Natronobacterium gregoryi]|uniref:AMP-dependent synthetase and ligase n=2 Tax=Natronobacterium gregoryi TaxID=44930 RepID=L0AC18_NATGS|nr:AMP-binding protein [Natronobacterium gregoryi]AFZ71411.1 acyl-CoA synthetase (AMP-forming)/AMP-acid ligase II [Natronobacterium gregoryi SP2]ELY66936.1 AMP-dependent synthetase and ligase [Natronobacterium gregoryi SP2]PLK21210.1 long-chain fatty acid--CoA ligase [Natronobacterium gregoryi SP2]SFI84394.1 fatty-acyl-CoA synthase [Natronobacterium gregoryi]